MKKTLTIAALAATMGALSASAQNIIAGWDTFDVATAPAATIIETGFTATAAATSSGSIGTGEGTSRGSSDDGTWGTVALNSAPSTAAGTDADQNWTVFNGAVTAEITFTIANTGASDYNLNAFHMDALAFRPNAPRTYALNVLSGDLTVGNVFTSATDAITSQGGAPADNNSHDDIDISLAALADFTLAAGESAVLQVVFSDGSGSGPGHHLWVDNIGFSGAVVPEPSTYALLGGLFALSFVAMRRRK